MQFIRIRCNWELFNNGKPYRSFRLVSTNDLEWPWTA